MNNSFNIRVAKAADPGLGLLDHASGVERAILVDAIRQCGSAGPEAGASQPGGVWVRSFASPGELREALIVNRRAHSFDPVVAWELLVRQDPVSLHRGLSLIGIISDPLRLPESGMDPRVARAVPEAAEAAAELAGNPIR